MIIRFEGRVAGLITKNGSKSEDPNDGTPLYYLPFIFKNVGPDIFDLEHLADVDERVKKDLAIPSYTEDDLRKAFEAGQHNGKHENGINTFEEYLNTIKP